MHLQDAQLASDWKLKLPHRGLQEVEQYEDSADFGEPELVHEYDDHAVSDFQHAFHVSNPPLHALQASSDIRFPGSWLLACACHSAFVSHKGSQWFELSNDSSAHSSGAGVHPGAFCHLH